MKIHVHQIASTKVKKSHCCSLLWMIQQLYRFTFSIGGFSCFSNLKSDSPHRQSITNTSFVVFKVYNMLIISYMHASSNGSTFLETLRLLVAPPMHSSHHSLALGFLNFSPTHPCILGNSMNISLTFPFSNTSTYCTAAYL